MLKSPLLSLSTNNNILYPEQQFYVRNYFKMRLAKIKCYHLSSFKREIFLKFKMKSFGSNKSLCIRAHTRTYIRFWFKISLIYAESFTLFLLIIEKISKYNNKKLKVFKYSYLIVYISILFFFSFLTKREKIKYILKMYVWKSNLFLSN